MPGTDVSVAAFMLPGLLALQVAFAGAFGVATVLATEREDGTLLRLKAVPYGTVGYVAGQLVRVCIEIAFSMVIVLVPAAFFVPGLMSDGLGAALGAVGYLLLGLLAVLPLGFIIGSIFKNPRSVGGWGMLVMAGDRLGVRHLLAAGHHGDLGADPRSADADLLAGPRAALDAAAGGRGRGGDRRQLAHPADHRGAG